MVKKQTKAGADQTIALSVNSVSLVGSASADAGNQFFIGGGIVNVAAAATHDMQSTCQVRNFQF